MMWTHPRPLSPRLQPLYVAAVLALSSLLVAAGGCLRPAPPAPSVRNESPAGHADAHSALDLLPASFAGNRACLPCHQREFRTVASSNHAMTLHRLGISGSARVQPPVGRVPRSEMEIRKREGRYYAASVGRTEALSITYALGSGKTGTTYIAAITDGRMIELSKSFFPSSRTWYTTPGHEHDQPSDIGMVYSRDGAKRCLS